nr:zinc finger, PMZ-type [Tanacetum cinerariifolium]
MLANYGVANGYQLWFMQNDYNKLLVYYGRDVCEGKCAAFKRKKPKDKLDHAECTNFDIGDISSKPDHAECSSKPATKKNGQLSTTIGRDGNNQMYLLAWAVVRVENKDNWAWFLSLLQEYLELRYGGGLTVISNGHKLSFKLEDTITPFVRKKLEYLKEKQRSWLVYPSAFREVEVRRGDYGYGVNLHTKKCGCKFWELSGIPCVHDMTSYYHMNMDPELGTVPNSSVEQSIPTAGKPPQIPNNSKGKGIDMGTKKGNTNVLAGSSKKRGTTRIGSLIKRGEDNQVTSGGSMGNLTAKEYQHKMDMAALAEVQREIATEEAEQERIRQI